MLADPALWLERPLQFLGLSLGVMLAKALIVFGVALLFGLGARVGVLAGLGLAQIGEFSFLLAQSGASLGLIGGDRYQQFLAVSVLTMTLTPFAILLAPRLAAPAERVAWPSLPWTPSKPSAPAPEGAAAAGAARRGDAVGAAVAEAAGGTGAASGTAAAAAPGHVVIVGYGLNGGNVARVLRGLGIPVVVLELNPATVRRAQARGESVVYGDATNREVLRHTGVERARALVIAIADPVASRQIVAVARAANPGLTVIVRARYVSEVEALHRAGADVVVPEEFETSLELAGAAMATFGASPRMIEREKAAIREERYASLAAEGRPVTPHLPLSRLFGAADVAAVDLPPDSLAAGSTLRELDLRGRTGASVVALARDDKVLGNPGPDLVLRGGDVLYVWGDARQLARARAVLEQGAGPPGPGGPA
jgi:CPA2 family monovalent cation:H+ antiporter-2